MKIKSRPSPLGIGHLLFSFLAIGVGVALLLIADKPPEIGYAIVGGGTCGLSILGGLLVYITNKHPVSRIVGLSAATIILLVGAAVLAFGEAAISLLFVTLCLYLAIDGATEMQAARAAKELGIRAFALPLSLGALQIGAAFTLLCMEVALPVLTVKGELYLFAVLFFLDAVGNAISPAFRLACHRAERKRQEARDEELRIAWEKEWRATVADPDREMSEEERARREERIRAEERIRTEERLRIERELRGETDAPVDEGALRDRIRAEEERIRADERARLETELRLHMEAEARRRLEEERRLRLEAEERLRAESEERRRIEQEIRRLSSAAATGDTLDETEAFLAAEATDEEPIDEPYTEPPPDPTEPDAAEEIPEAPKAPKSHRPHNHAMDEGYTDGRKYGRGSFYDDEE